MVSISDPLSVENGGAYYKVHYSAAGEYYAPTEAPTIGQAIGKGAETLGIVGNITAEQFDSLLRGIDPSTDAALRGHLNRAQANERAGFDMTFSPPKSISIQALVAGDARLIEIQWEAVREAMQEVERCALARQRGGRQEVLTDNICAVMFEHFDARESQSSQHGPMPQLHHHLFIMNFSQRPDGQWRSLQEQEIYKARGYIDAVYMNSLARRVQEIGYHIVRTPDHHFELADYTREQILAFSERYQDIEQVKAEKGITNPRAAREIVVETRKAKHDYDPEVLKREREQLAGKYGIDINYRPTAPVQSFAISPDAQAERSLLFALAHTTERNAVPDHKDILTAALRHGIGAFNFEHIRAQMATQERVGNLIGEGRSHHHPLGTYTTREMEQLEQQNLALVRDHINLGRPVSGIVIRSAVDGTLSSTGKPEVEKWAASRHLLPDQTAAAVLTLSTPKWASAIEGYAGSTKTTTVGAVREFAEQKGWAVRGFGTTSGSVNALSDAGINAQTIAKMLATPLPAKAGRELWIIDESSLLATRPANQMLKLARDRGVERIVFVGDQRQHLAIEAGSPVRQFLANNLAVAELTTIRRQKDPGLLQAVELTAAERIPEAVDLLIEQKRIVEIPDRAKRYERIAAEYLSGHEASQRTLVVSPANNERKAINQAIRSTLVEHRYVASIGQKHEILAPRDMTNPERTHARSYHEGDVLYFRRGSKRQGIPKGAYLTVSAVNDTNLTLHAENGRRVEFDPSKLKGVQAYTVESRTIAVGDRIEWREPQRGIANHQQGVITKLDQREIEVKFDSGRKVSMPLSQARVVDLAYAVTSHASQGGTVDRVIINIDSSRSAELVNERQFYVSLSRARIDARVYTDDAEHMRRSVTRTQTKELALDIVQKQHQQQRQSVGMRI